MKIDEKTVPEISKKKEPEMIDEMTEILTWVEKLNEVSTDGIEQFNALSNDNVTNILLMTRL